MKIGILTFVHAYNYGAELQCFALQRKLRNLGYECEVLDIYRPSDPEYKKNKNTDKRFKQLYAFNNVSDVKARLHTIASKVINNIFCFIYHKKYKERKNNFLEFHKKYTNLSTHVYYNFGELYSREMDYTHIIVGSDQVWNFMNEFSVEPFFLTFAKKAKKISYAASIGHSNIPEELKAQYQLWSAGMSDISLREERGVEIMKELTGRNDICCVLDPTLLLNKEEWCASLNIIDNISENYVLLYLLSMSSFSIELAKTIAAFNGYKIKIVSTNAISVNKDSNIEYYDGVSPRKFVELFAHASFIVTNSFHGTAFSVNFNVPFYSTTKKSKRYNSRFESLLGKTHLINRLLFEEDGINDTILSEANSISFDLCNKALDLERNFSLNFLDKVLNINDKN